MKTLPAKIHRLFRFHSILVILVLAGLGWLMLRYFEMWEVYVEKISFKNNLQLIERMLFVNQHLSKPTRHACEQLNDPALFAQPPVEKGIGMALMGNKSQSSHKWHYDAKRHVLTYEVRSSQRYFRSPTPKAIDIHFYCENKAIKFTVSRHQWCQKMNIFYCKKWK